MKSLDVFFPFSCASIYFAIIGLNTFTNIVKSKTPWSGVLVLERGYIGHNYKMHQLLSLSIELLQTNCVIIYSWLGWTISASYVGEENSTDDMMNILLFFIKVHFFFLDNRVKYIIRMNRDASTKFSSGSVALILVFLMLSSFSLLGN